MKCDHCNKEIKEGRVFNDKIVHHKCYDDYKFSKRVDDFNKPLEEWVKKLIIKERYKSDTYNKPNLIILTTKDNEVCLVSFDSKQEIIDYIEEQHGDSDSWEIYKVYVNNKEVQYEISTNVTLK